MIARTWGERVPLPLAAAFHRVVRPVLETVSFHFNVEEGKSSPATRKEEI